MAQLDRRDFLGAATAGAATGLVSASAAASPARGLGVTGLRTSQLANPIGLADQAPTFSWRITGARRGIMQASYRIRVASSTGVLAAGKADVWDSGRVNSAESVGVRYAGPPLVSRARYWWTVEISDDAGQSARADAPGWWEMALLDPADWRAAWVAAESVGERADREAGMTSYAAPVPAGQAARLFRLPFTSDAAGEAVVTLFSTGILRNVTLDGVPLTLPSHPVDSYGGPPAARLVSSITPGAHVLAAEVTAPRGYVPVRQVTIAAQVRLPGASSVGRYVVDGWRTALSAPDGWRLAGSSDSGWDMVSPTTPQPITPWPATPAVMMRHGFDAPAQVGRARLYVAALGAHDVRINGRAVSADRLQSESSDFRKTILYRCYDVTELVQGGRNVIGAVIGDGWYASYMAPVGRYALGPAPRRWIAQLEIDGRPVAMTGEGWRMAPSPILSSELYNGEYYDARREQPGWDRDGFDDSGWTPCRTADRPAGVLTAQAGPAVRITRTLKPVSVRQVSPDVAVVDFGQNFAGLARLKVRGAAGTLVTLRFAEIVHADGSVDQRNLRAAQATDRYVLRGDPAGEVFLPSFTFHGFRYVHVEGAPADWSVEGAVMSSALDETGLFTIDQPRIQKLWLNTLWSQRSNFLAIPTDCPQRDERLGWTGDAQVFWDAAAYNMDVAAFTRRFLRDLRDGQTAKGAFPMFAPCVDAPPGASPGWADAGVMLPWVGWQRYGDVAMVREHWDAMCRYVDGVIADNPGLIWRVVMAPDFSDWLSLDAKYPGDATTPKDLVATAMLKRSLDQLADMGAAIGKADEARAYRDKAAAATRAFQAAFVKDDGTVGNGSHTGYILAIRLGLLTPTQQAAAGEKLVADIRRRGTLLSTGFLGTPLSLDAIADIGDIGLVYDLLLRTAFPSWGYMVTKGATTIWERWNGDTGDIAMNSYNHYALGAVIGFLYRRVAGIEALAPGFARVRIAPLIDPRVPDGGAHYDSVRGRISVHWRQDANGALTLDAIIPANIRAEIRLPIRDGARLRESGRTTERHAAIRHLAAPSGMAVVELGSGHYRFQTR